MEYSLAVFTLTQPGTQVMGVLNVTPDSFYDGGKHYSPQDALEHAKKMLAEGAAIIDVGGESTRPGADLVSPDEQAARVIPVIRELKRTADCMISIDTTSSLVARQAVEAGAGMINDVSAGLIDPGILQVAAESGAWYVAMHMRGTPETMQSDTDYSDLIGDMKKYFRQRIDQCLAAGIQRDRLILDPGIGFGKEPLDNYRLLAELERFRTFDLPLLVGPSRKSFLKLTRGGEKTDDRLAGTVAAVTICALKGVEIVRVHDVKEAMQAIDVVRRVDHFQRDKSRETEC